jgi:hypothetical protein
LSARYVLTQSFEMGRDGWRTRIDTRAEMSSDRDHFYVTGTLTAYENGIEVAARRWQETIVRDLI